MLVVFPLGLLGGSLLFDIAYLVSDQSRWAEMAYWMIVVGVPAGLLTAAFGFIDWLMIPRRTRARRVGVLHAVANVVMLGLFVASWILRHPQPLDPPGAAIGCSLLGIALAAIAGWLGGELVDRHGIGVADDASLNARSSLSRSSPTVGNSTRT